MIAASAKEERRVRGLLRTRALLSRAIDALLRIGWPQEGIFLLGFSAGAQVAVDLALHFRSSLPNFANANARSVRRLYSLHCTLLLISALLTLKIWWCCCHIGVLDGRIFVSFKRRKRREKHLVAWFSSLSAVSNPWIAR